jgi:hypothetical protein
MAELRCVRRNRERDDLTAYQENDFNLLQAYEEYKLRDLDEDETDGWNHWEYINCLDRDLLIRNQLEDVRKQRKRILDSKNAHQRVQPIIEAIDIVLDNGIEKRNMNSAKIRTNMRSIETIFTEVDGDVRYRNMRSNHEGTCKEVNGINVGYVEIKVGVNLRTHKFVIFRWGQWRVFDPIRMIIRVEPEVLADRELGTNPITDRPYPNRPSMYHTVLNNLGFRDARANNRPLYYSINRFTFYRGDNNCRAVIRYRTDFHRPEEVTTCAEIDEFEINSNISMFVMKYIVRAQNAPYFLDYFVREFDGITDEMIRYGYIGDNLIHNLMEEAILTPGQLRILRERYTQ